ncbi:hypothetical protein M404DRAFT_1007200 [Pisolithus tinctorius Marx 270]|uniref:Uncharacterized protein n=1 Tax=Pisolithus tinctorius Marx 270 TaxID=870435 RepID=A0A0C3NJJ9_PISTI|nr:hypothetical protein M404DRAFT_1007200 [Pisolithus tinctorius Marx 270]
MNHGCPHTSAESLAFWWKRSQLKGRVSPERGQGKLEGDGHERCGRWFFKLQASGLAALFVPTTATFQISAPFLGCRPARLHECPARPTLMYTWLSA